MFHLNKFIMPFALNFSKQFYEVYYKLFFNNSKCDVCDQKFNDLRIHANKHLKNNSERNVLIRLVFRKMIGPVKFSINKKLIEEKTGLTINEREKDLFIHNELFIGFVSTETLFNRL